jgi:ankyrin repeat protein
MQRTALHAAAAIGRLEIGVLLLKAGKYMYMAVNYVCAYVSIHLHICISH